ncbi:hypothetical protein D3C83_118980 [compost metagenome]
MSVEMKLPNHSHPPGAHAGSHRMRTFCAADFGLMGSIVVPKPAASTRARATPADPTGEASTEIALRSKSERRLRAPEETSW